MIAARFVGWLASTTFTNNRPRAICHATLLSWSRGVHGIFVVCASRVLGAVALTTFANVAEGYFSSLQLSPNFVWHGMLCGAFQD